MERFAWKAKILTGQLEEYKKRHDEIWPEMSAVLDQAGIHNYTIWTDGLELFGYYECESIKKAAGIQAGSAVVDKWNIYMKDVMEMAIDPQTGTAVLLKQIFLHNGK